MEQKMVRNWMTKNPVIIGQDEVLAEARKKMQLKNIRRLPVVNDGKLVGIITLGDLHIAELTNVYANMSLNLNEKVTQFCLVKDVMTREPKTITVDAAISDAANIMLAYKIGGLPVMQEDELVGILTETDIYRLLAETDLT